MTNSPVFEQQLALDDYWKTIGGTVFLPGTTGGRRFRARLVLHRRHPENRRHAHGPGLRIQRDPQYVRPAGDQHAERAEHLVYRWRTVSDQKNLTYFFESTLYPNVFWVDFRDVDFAPGAPVKMLDLVSGKTYAGNAAERFRDAAPFEFQGIG